MNNFDSLYNALLESIDDNDIPVILTEGVIDSLFTGAKNLQIFADIKNMLASFKSISANVLALIRKYIADIIKNLNSKTVSFLASLLKEIKVKSTNKFFMLPLLVLALSAASTFSANGAIKDHMPPEDYTMIVKVFKQSRQDMEKTYTNMNDEDFEKLKDIIDNAIQRAAKGTDKKSREDLDNLKSMNKDNRQMHFYYTEAIEAIETDDYVVEIDDGDKVESITINFIDELFDLMQDHEINRIDKLWLNPMKLYSTLNKKTMVVNGLDRDEVEAVREYVFKHRGDCR